MSDRWDQEFDFYFGFRDDIPVVTFLDMAAMDRQPVRTHETAVIVRVPMKHPDENGLRSQEDFAEMMHVEEQLVDSFANNFDAIYCGREVTEGRTDFLFYASAPPAPELRTEATALAQADGYAVEVQLSKDPDWDFYTDRYPTPYQQQTMLNRQLQHQMQRLGDNLAKRRKVDHLATFSTRDSAETAARNLRAAKFSTDRVQGPDTSGRFTLEFHRKDACIGFGPDTFVAEVFEAITPVGGTYDGWGSKLRR